MCDKEMRRMSIVEKAEAQFKLVNFPFGPRGNLARRRAYSRVQLGKQGNCKQEGRGGGGGCNNATFIGK